MTTLNRSLRAVMNKVLEEYGIDDLQLEIDLVAAVKSALDIDVEEAKGAMRALEVHEERKSKYAVDVSEFPEEVSDVIGNVCALWMITPPKRRKKGGEYAYWIDCARDILDACAEFDVSDVLKRVHTDYMMSTAENNGKTPYIVSGPCQLVKVCRAKTGQLRGEHINDTRRNGNGKDETSFHF